MDMFTETPVANITIPKAISDLDKLIALKKAEADSREKESPLERLERLEARKIGRKMEQSYLVQQHTEAEKKYFNDTIERLIQVLSNGHSVQNEKDVVLKFWHDNREKQIVLDIFFEKITAVKEDSRLLILRELVREYSADAKSELSRVMREWGLDDDLCMKIQNAGNK